MNLTPKGFSRRNFLSLISLLAISTVAKAWRNILAGIADGGLADIIGKKKIDRAVRIVPPGALSIRNFETHCTGCQLCVSACPNQILVPSNNLMRLMQPEISYQKGYCRPECVKCSEVCPAGAIKPINTVEKIAISVGHAVWIKEVCIPYRDGVICTNCERHCPTKAITMVAQNDYDPDLKIPVVDKELCIGCGACENLCPSRPYSAIYVEGNVSHLDKTGHILLEKGVSDSIINTDYIQCTACKDCMPCPYGIDIPGIFAHYNRCVAESNRLNSSNDENYKKARRAFLIGYDRSVPRLRQANHCIACNQCIHHCPQSIAIPEEMQRVDLYAEQLKQIHKNPSTK